MLSGIFFMHDRHHGKKKCKTSTKYYFDFEYEDGMRENNPLVLCKRKVRFITLSIVNYCIRILYVTEGSYNESFNFFMLF